MNLNYFQLFILAFVKVKLHLAKPFNCSELKINTNRKQSLTWNERLQFYKCGFERQEEAKEGEKVLLGGPSIINGIVDVNVIPFVCNKSNEGKKDNQQSIVCTKAKNYIKDNTKQYLSPFLI